MSNQINFLALAKAVAFIIWADKKIKKTELTSARSVFEKYDIKWNDVEPIIRDYLKEFSEATYLYNFDEQLFNDIDINKALGNIDFNVDDPKKILDELSKIVFSDNIVTKQEVRIIHLIAQASGLELEYATISMIKAIQEKYC